MNSRVLNACPHLIKTLLDHGASVNTHLFGESPIMLSVRVRKYYITDLLLTADDIENSEDWGTHELSHFHIACLRGHTRVARKLLLLGANVNEARKKESHYWPGYTALHFAVESQSTEMVQLILDCGASLKMKDAYSSTPLHLAHEIRNEEIIDILLAAHTFEFGNPEDSDGFSHFHISCTRNNVSVVEYFLKQGCNVNKKLGRRLVGWYEILPLELAIEYECPDVVELLLLHGAKIIDPAEYEGALSEAYFRGNRRIIDLLLSNNAKKDEIESAIPKMPDLHQALMSFDRKKIKLSLMDHDNKNPISDVNTPLIWNGLTPLHASVMCSFNIELVKLLIDCGANVTIKDAKMRTPLHMAFEFLKTNELELIIADLIDFDENPADSRGLTHFHIACTTNRIDLIRQYLELGREVEQFVNNDSVKWSGFGPLHFATKFKQLEVVDVLLKFGIQIFGGDLDPTPLDLAVPDWDFNSIIYSEGKKGDFQILEKILSEAEKSSNFNHVKSRGFSMLHIICATESEPDYEYLTKYVESYPDAINQVIDYVGSEFYGHAPIHVAMRTSNYGVSKWLLEKGANIHLKDFRGFSPLQYDIDDPGKYGILETNSKILCVPENPADVRGNSYFHIACKLGNVEIIQFFLRSGVNINLQTTMDIYGSCEAKTPLHFTIANGLSNVKETVIFLLNNGADVVARDAYLNTPLHHLSYNFHLEIVQELVNRGADVNARNVHGETPLHMICSSPVTFEETKGMIVSLLDFGADINARDVLGKTPLSYYECFIDNENNVFECLVILLKHIKKLEVLGRHISDENKKARAKSFEIWNVPHYDGKEFVEQCLAEIARMKDIRTDRYTTLYSLLSKNPNQMASICENLTFQEIIQSNEFYQNFPIYGYLLKLQYKIGLTRKPLLKKCEMLLSHSTRLSLQSSEKILEYLDNNDLENMIKSVQIGSSGQSLVQAGVI